MPRARAIVTVVAAAGVAGVFAWSAYRFLHEPVAESHAAPGSEDGSEKADAHARATESRKTHDALSEKGDHESLAPTVVAVEPRLEWPDATTLRRMEQGGRVLFGGIVRAPDGAPCEGVTVWVDGEVVATTDDRGAWRADVPGELSNDELDGALVDYGGHQVAARKEHVGFAIYFVEPRSRRIDLDLAAGLAFSGTVVDFDDGAPIGGAELELRLDRAYEHAVRFTARADALGRFAFPNLPEGNVYLRGRAPGYDSNGSFGYDFSKGRDMVVAFRLRRQFTLRGRFVPWPVPGVAPEKASVLATTKSPHDRNNRKLEFRGPIGPDGRFELPAPVCPSCALELDVGDEPYWSTELDTNEERREYDVGDIALRPAATLTGRFDAPPELRAQIVLGVQVDTPEGGRGLRVRSTLDADGSFRVAPLPPGAVWVAFRLGLARVASLEDASGLSGEDRSNGLVALQPGATVDVGVVATRETVLFGTVRDSEGRPLARTLISETVKLDSDQNNGSFLASTDSAGRFVGLRNLSFLTDDDAELESSLEHRATWEVYVEGHLSRRFDFEWSAGSRWIRHDLVLDAGVALTGVLVDAAGAPVAGANITVSNGEGPGTRFGSDTTRTDGSFEILGLSAGAHRIYASDAAGALRFDDVHPEKGPVTLRPSEAAKN